MLIAQSAAAGWGPTPEWCKVNADPFYCKGMNHVPAKEILSPAPDSVSFQFEPPN